MQHRSLGFNTVYNRERIPDKHVVLRQNNYSELVTRSAARKPPEIVP